MEGEPFISSDAAAVSILAHLPNPVFVIDDSDRFTYLNNAAEMFFQSSQVMLIGVPLRTLIAAECIGDGRWFIEKASQYARDRVVFGRPIGQNQGVQFPIAKAHIEVEAADLMRWRACEQYDRGENAGASANMAKYLAAEASWAAANACLQTHGGFGFANEYDVERKFRETRLYQVAPISTNLIMSYVAEHLLELPRSF